MTIESFMEIYNMPIKNYLRCSKNMPDEILEQSKLVDFAFQAEIRFLELTYKFKQPFFYHDRDLLVQPLKHAIQKVQNTDNANKFAQFISDSIPILEWVFIDNPVTFIKGIIKNALAFESDNFKICTLAELNWTSSWIQGLRLMYKFVEFHHYEGLNWYGIENLPPPVLLGDASFVHRNFDHLALYTDVQRDKTECRRILRQVDRTDSKNNQIAELFEQNGKRWRIEHPKGDHKNLVIHSGEMDTVYIYNCYDCSILFENAVEVIRMDSCRKVCVIFKSVLNEFKLVDCKRVNIHVFDSIPKIMVDSSKYINIFLNQKALKVLVYTMQCHNVTVQFPYKNGVWRCFTVPEKLVTTINPNSGLETIVIT